MSQNGSKKHHFELRVDPQPEGDYRLELWERAPPDTRPEKDRQEEEPVSAIGGWNLELAGSLVRRTIEQNGYKAAQLKRTRKAPFKLNEEDGVRLDLAFRAVGNLKKRSRIEDILMGIQKMSREEALYWHSKVARRNGRPAGSGLKALRVLLGGDTR